MNLRRRTAALLTRAGRHLAAARINARRRSALRQAHLDRLGGQGGAVDTQRSDRELSDATEDLIMRLDFATVAELRCAARAVERLLHRSRPVEGSQILEAVVDLVDAEANRHEAAIDRELTTMLRPYGNAS